MYVNRYRNWCALSCVLIHTTNTAHQYRNLFTCMRQPTHLERQCWKLWVRSESPPRFSTIQPVAASHLWPRFGAEKQASKQGREGVWPRFGAEKQTSKQDREGVSPLYHEWQARGEAIMGLVSRSPNTDEGGDAFLLPGVWIIIIRTPEETCLHVSCEC